MIFVSCKKREGPGRVGSPGVLEKYLSAKPRAEKDCPDLPIPTPPKQAAMIPN